MKTLTSPLRFLTALIVATDLSAATLASPAGIARLLTENQPGRRLQVGLRSAIIQESTFVQSPRQIVSSDNTA